MPGLWVLLLWHSLVLCFIPWTDFRYRQHEASSLVGRLTHRWYILHIRRRHLFSAEWARLSVRRRRQADDCSCRRRAGESSSPTESESILPKIAFTSIWGAKYKKTVDHTLTGFLVYSLEPGFFYPGSYHSLMTPYYILWLPRAFSPLSLPCRFLRWCICDMCHFQSCP